MQGVTRPGGGQHRDDTVNHSTRPMQHGASHGMHGHDQTYGGGGPGGYGGPGPGLPPPPPHSHQMSYHQQQQHHAQMVQQYGLSSAMAHLANTPYASYAMPYAPHAPVPPPPAVLPHYGAPPPPPPPGQHYGHHQQQHSQDPFNLLPIPPPPPSGHGYMPPPNMGMGYLPYPSLPPPPLPQLAPQLPHPASHLQQQSLDLPRPPSRPIASTSTSTGAVARSPKRVSPLPLPQSSASSAVTKNTQPPSQRPPKRAATKTPAPIPNSDEDDDESDADRQPRASTLKQRNGRASPQRVAAGKKRQEQSEEDQDAEGEDDDEVLRLPTPPPDLGATEQEDKDNNSDDYEPEAPRRRAGGRLRDAPPVKRPRTSTSVKEEENPRTAAARRRAARKKARKRRQKEEAPPGVETTVDGSWKRKLSRGGWGAPGQGSGPGSRPETFLRKLWKLMQDPNTDISAYMHWDQSGKLLIIPDEKALVDNVCKVHFAQKNITSFNKQMNNWDFKRHARSQKDLEIIGQTEPNVTRSTRIWYHPALDRDSTLEDVQNVGRHEDGMAKKRRIKSKHTGVLEDGIGTGRGKRSWVTPPTQLEDFPKPPGMSPTPTPRKRRKKASESTSRAPSASTSNAPMSTRKRKRPRYAESDDDADGFSDTSSEGDSNTDDDESSGSRSDEDAAGSAEEDSDEDAEGEPDEELIAAQEAKKADVKGKGKAVAPPSKSRGRHASSSAKPSAPEKPLAGPSSSAGPKRGRRSSPAPDEVKYDATPAPTTKRAAALAASKAAKEKAAAEKAQQDEEDAKARVAAAKASSMAGARGRRSSHAATQSAAATPEDDAKQQSATEVAAPPSRPSRTARRRNSVVEEEAAMSESKGENPPTANKDLVAKGSIKNKRLAAAEAASAQPQPDTATGGRRTRASRGGDQAPESAPVEQPADAGEGDVPMPTRRSARASNARAARDNVVADGADPEVAVASASAEESGPSRGTRGAARGARTSLAAGPAQETATKSAGATPASKAAQLLAESSPAGSARRGRGGARGGRGGRGGAARGRGGAAGASKAMRRGGAGFRAGDAARDNEETDDVRQEGDEAAIPTSLSFNNGGGDGIGSSARAAHVYSLPRPPHLGKTGSASNSRDASVSASGEAGPSGVNRSPSVASSHFLYPDASNPYGSSPYPAYPHQTQTPVMTHHHPTRPLAGVYHSEPGLARTAFYYHGVSPISRPYIHPEHHIPPDLLENGDEASLFGSEFATASSMGDARLAGASALAAYRMESPPVARPVSRSPAVGGRATNGLGAFPVSGAAAQRRSSFVDVGDATKLAGTAPHDAEAAEAGDPGAQSRQDDDAPAWSAVPRGPSELFPELQADRQRANPDSQSAAE